MQSILRPSDGGMLIMIAFILMGAVGSMHFLGGGTSSSLLYAQSDKMLMRVMLFERSIRNGVAHVMETGTCLNDGIELQSFLGLSSFRSRLISSVDNGAVDNGSDLDVEGNNFRNIAKCLLGTAFLPRDIQFNSFKLDRLSRPYAAVQFAVTVDIAVKTQGGAGGQSLSYRTAVTDQKLFFSALAANHLGYVFKTQGGEQSENDLILHENESAHIEFHAPVFIYNTADNMSGISNLLTAVGDQVFFNDVVRSNFHQINYFALASGHYSLGKAKSVFKHGVSTRRWTNFNDEKLNILGFEVVLQDEETIEVNSDACTSQQKPYENDSTIEVKFLSNQDKFCGFIHTQTLKITIDNDDNDEHEMYFEGGFVVEKLEIEGGKNTTILFGESNTGSVDDLYKVSM